MWEHHRRAIARLVEIFGNDPRYPALIVGGSLAKGWGREDSDVDIILLATDKEYRCQATTGSLHYFNAEVCDYPGGYVDGKVVDRGFLEDVAARGTEPARAAFRGAFLAYSRGPDLEALIASIPIYPEAERARKMQSFFSQVIILNWYVGEAEKRGDRYLLSYAVTHLALFSVRLILAYNRALFPYHKWMMTVLREVKEKPVDLERLVDDLLREPSAERARAVADCVLSFRDWGFPPERAAAVFMADSEWNWRSGTLPPEDC